MLRRSIGSRVILAGALILAAHGRCAADETNQQAPGGMGKYALPDDPDAPVIVLDFKGGFTPPRISEEPALTIQADGDVVIPARFEGQKSFRGKISRREIDQLLDFAIVANDFFKYDADKVAQELAGKGPGLRIADAATTVIRITANGRTKEVSHYALGMGRGVKQLDQLAAIQRRLLRVQSIVQLGGKENVKKWLAVVNAELKKKFPDAPPLSADDLQSGGERGDGSVYVSFQRMRQSDEEGGPAEVASGFVNKPADGPAQVNVVYRKP